MGKNTIKELLPDLCARAGIPRYTGHSLRSTFIACASNACLSDVQIAQRTGHKCIESLDTYKIPTSTVEQATAAKFQKSLTGRVLANLPAVPSNLPSSSAMVVSSNQTASGVFAESFHNEGSGSIVIASSRQHAPPHTTQHSAPQNDMQSALSLYNAGFASIIDRFR